jgi:UDP-N-acetylglucosamine--N-acetylmuramyl-(pentapeptide) pyrophosphoryl-undecaprenol N-acetylglucosamine transferase
MICGGGTGGHVYPALTVARQLLAKEQGFSDEAGIEPSGGPTPAPVPLADILYVGSRGGIEEELVSREGIPFAAIPAAGLRGKSAGQTVRNLWAMGGGLAASWRLVGRFRPGALFATGGYVSAPVALAARGRGVPILIYLPDVEPGLTIRLLGRLARRIAVTAPDSCAYFPPGKAFVSGYPVRQRLFTADRAASRRALGLSQELPVLLAFGGSQGARSINRALATALPALLEKCQVLHISGRRDLAEARAQSQALPAHLRQRYHLYEYLHEEMVDALAAADLAVCRAGASVMGELPAAGLPGLLVPYLYAGGHQALNAAYLADQGAAVALQEAGLAEKLLPAALELLNDRERLERMSAAARSLARPQAARHIAYELSIIN